MFTTCDLRLKLKAELKSYVENAVLTQNLNCNFVILALKKEHDSALNMGCSLSTILLPLKLFVMAMQKPL